MADNTINVKIREAYDTEANWTQKNPVLLQGQIAISSDKHGMYKVGDGTKTWGQLDYASHPASDVYAWAKAETKPSYSSSEISGAVTGVKGAAEASYRTGNVNLTSANIGAVNKSGDTMTGTLVAKGGQFYGSNNASGIDMNNSDIININSIYMADLSDDSREGIHFYRAANTYDSIHAKNGVLYFTPNHAKDNAGTSFPILYHENGYLEQAMYVNIHPENNPIIIPFIHNDIAYLLERGGSATVLYDGVSQGVNISGVFDGSGSYGFAMNPTGVNEIIIELTLHKQFGWTNTIYVDFGSQSWRAKNIKIEVMNQNITEDTWTQKGSVTGWQRGHYFVRFYHIPPGAPNGGTGFNKIRLTFSDWATATIFRIAAIGVYNYSSQGLRETFLPKNGGQMFGSITPYGNSKYDLGNTSNYWKNGYFTNINGAAVGSSPVFTDKNVTQTASDSTNSTVELLLAGNSGNTTETVGARKSAKFYVNPSVGYLYSEGYNRINITGRTLDLDSISFSNGDQSPNIKRYICKTNGGSANISNRPVTTQLPFLLDVEAFRINTSTDFYTLQTYRYCPSADSLPEEWQRWCLNGTWKAWKKKEFSDTTYTAATAAPGKIATSSAVGTSLNYARQDHTHGIDLATGDANGQVKIAGSNVSVKGLAALAYKDSIGKADVGLDNVDNKSSETIRGEITSANVTAALGYTPVNKAGDNMSGALYIVNTANDTAGLASALESKSFKFGLHIGTGGTNHGIYDFKKSGWVLLGNAQHNWTFNGNASTATTAANVSTQAATADADRHVWFSDATTETRRNHDDDFKYNPSTNVLTVGQINGSATLTGTPTAPTATAGTNSTQIATTAFVKTAIDNLIDGAPEAYDTLKDISDYISTHSTEYEALLAITGDKADAADAGAQLNLSSTTLSLLNKSGTTLNSVTLGKANVGLGNVENKSSATIRSEITKDNVTNALGYTPPTSVTVSGSNEGIINLDSSPSTLTLTRRNAFVGQSSNADSSKPWYKVASVTSTGAYQDFDVVFLVNDAYTSRRYGILHVHGRCNGDQKYESCSLQWLSHTGFALDDFRLYHNQDVAPTIFELWVKIGASHLGRRFVVLSEGARTKADDTQWTLYTTFSVGSEEAPTSDYEYISSQNAGIINKAGALNTARNIDGVSFNGSADIVHYGTCDTDAGTAAKTVACSGFNLVTGAWIAVRFTKTNTAAIANLTLNVNSTGAKAIKYRNANLPSASDLANGRTYFFVYDGTYWQWIGDRNTDTPNLRVYRQTTGYNGDYPLLVSRTAAGSIGTSGTNDSYSNIYAVMWNDTTKTPTLNPSTGELKATKFSGAFNGALTGAAQSNVLKTGDTMSGVLTLQKGSLIHFADASGGSNGFFKVAQLVIGGSYQNAPIEIAFTRRQDHSVTRIYITFTNASGSDPTLDQFGYIGFTNDAYIYKEATSTWNIYIKKAESYDRVDIVDYHMPSKNGQTTVTWLNEFVEQLPTGYTQASLVGKINAAATADNATSADALKNFRTSTTTNLGIDSTTAGGAVGYVNGLTKANWNYQQADGAIYSHTYNGAWEHQIYADYRTGQISVRGKNNGTWQDWRRILDESNFSSIITNVVAKTGDTMSDALTLSAGNVTTQAGNLVSGTSARTNEAQVWALSKSGGMYMYSSGNESGNGSRGIWVQAHGTSNGKSVFVVDTNNNVTFNGNLNGSPYVASLKGTSGSGRLMLTNEDGIDADDNGYRQIKTIASDIGWHYKPGSQSAGGYAYIQLGNNTNYTTTNGTRGFLRLYGNTSYWTDLYAPNSTSNHYIALPNRGGTIFTTEMFSLSGTTLTISTS